MPNPITLAIDTAAPRLQLGVLKANGTVDRMVIDLATGHAEVLFPAIATLLARNALGYANLERVAVTTGPGSFTGLRIGLSAARGIALARAIPAIGVPSLLALSLSGEPDRPVLVRLDARRGEAYVQTFNAPSVPASEPRLIAIDDAMAMPHDHGHLIDTPFIDIALMAAFAAGLDPLAYPPDAAYIRSADAKPQSAKRIERL